MLDVDIAILELDFKGFIGISGPPRLSCVFID
jgi:hypothetical protein